MSTSNHDPRRALLRRRASHDWKHDAPAALRTVEPTGATPSMLRDTPDHVCFSCGYNVCSCPPKPRVTAAQSGRQVGKSGLGQREPCSLPGGLVPPGWRQTKVLGGQLERYELLGVTEAVVALKPDQVVCVFRRNRASRAPSLEAGMLLAMGWVRRDDDIWDSPTLPPGRNHRANRIGACFRVTPDGRVALKDGTNFPSLVHAAHWCMTGECAE